MLNFTTKLLKLINIYVILIVILVLCILIYSHDHISSFIQKIQKHNVWRNDVMNTIAQITLIQIFKLHIAIYNVFELHINSNRIYHNIQMQ